MKLKACDSIMYHLAHDDCPGFVPPIPPNPPGPVEWSEERGQWIAYTDYEFDEDDE